ncbi:hypothetical protein B296_00012735 [Ensete ventricosum]|uniref:Transposase (putative) gypsy type domain-containing protein n=1 Tax=Ensete ventricosum TaxID=4639 RepID=A0A426YVI7_ENSVE|nr:hypothetical protein B296_00012735 [Ensete ventricosum]
MCISMDALEVGLRFPLHLLIEECLRWWRISPSQLVPNSWRYLVVFLGESQGAGIIPTRDLFMACFWLYQMDLDELRGMPKVSGGKAPSTRTTAREVGVSLAREAPKASSKRPIDAPTEQADDPARRHKKLKVLTRRHKSRHGEGESRSHSKDKKPAAPSKEPDTPVESDEREEFERGLLHPQLVRELYTLPSEVLLARAAKEMVLELDTLKSGGGPKAVTKAEERASELGQELEKTKRERDKALLRLEASEKDLSEVRSNLAVVQRLLKEARVRARKMDDELLQAVKALENARTELPRQAVVQYKESAGFKEGQKRMG